MLQGVASLKPSDSENAAVALTAPKPLSPPLSASSSQSNIPTPVKKPTMSVNTVKKPGDGPPTPTVKKVRIVLLRDGRPHF